MTPPGRYGTDTGQELEAFKRWDAIEASLGREFQTVRRAVAELEKHRDETAGVHKVVRWILGLVAPMALGGIVTLIVGHTRLETLESRAQESEAKQEHLAARVSSLQTSLAEVKKDTAHAADMSDRSYHETVRRMDRLEQALPLSWRRRMDE